MVAVPPDSSATVNLLRRGGAVIGADQKAQVTQGEDVGLFH